MTYEEPQAPRRSHGAAIPAAPVRRASDEVGAGWLVASLGVVVLVVGQLVSFVLTAASGPDGRALTWYAFYALGTAIVALGLTWSASFGRQLSVPVRAALLLAAVFITAGGLFSGLYGLFGMRM